MGTSSCSSSELSESSDRAGKSEGGCALDTILAFMDKGGPSLSKGICLRQILLCAALPYVLVSVLLLISSGGVVEP